MDLSVFSTRKLGVAAVLLSVALVVVYVKGDIPSNFLSFLEIFFGVYVAGNSVEHVTTAVLTNIASKASKE